MQEPVATWLQGQLPDYMLPAQWITLPQLPLNPNGKIDRGYLRSYETGGPELAADDFAADFVDEFEKAIAGIWSTVLGNDSLGVQQDFFAAGGDSILAVRLTTEVQRFLDDTVFLAALFDAPTVRSYADWLREHHFAAVARCCGGGTTEAAASVAASQAAQLPIVAGASAEPAELSWPQQSLWFLQQLYPNSTGANEQFLIRVSGNVNVDRLCAAWYEVLRRHDALRTCFSSAGSNGHVTQRVVSADVCAGAGSTPRTSLADLGQGIRLAAAKKNRGTGTRNTLRSCSRRRCLRAHLYILSDEVVLLVTAHHIIADGMCVQLIRDELSQAYSRDIRRPLPELQYADFSRWQRELLSDDFIASDLRWWQETLGGP